MPLTVGRCDRSSGFSLVEVLVALAIAAALSTALMHTFSNTRHSATRIRELIDSMTLCDNLLAQMSAQKIQAARMGGRNRGFTWRLVIEPVNYPLNVVKYSEDIQPDRIKDTENVKEVEPYKQAKSEDDKINNEGAQKWTGYRVVIVVRTPSGRKHVVETFRVGQRTADEKQD